MKLSCISMLYLAGCSAFVAQANSSIEAVDLCTQEANQSQMEGAEFESYIAMCLESISPAQSPEAESDNADDANDDIPYDSIGDPLPDADADTEYDDQYEQASDPDTPPAEDDQSDDQMSTEYQDQEPNYEE